LPSPDLILNELFALLELVFKNRYVAPLILLPAMLLAASGIWLYASYRSRPFIASAKARVAVLRKALGEESEPAAERNHFAGAFGDISAAMGRMTRGADSLVRAWHEFHESIVDETETPVRNTTRPSAFFMRATPRQRDLIFWSNTFIGLGLILTFLGIVVALNATSDGMREGASATESQEALRDLLTVASVKFFTSIGGLVAGLMLRFAEHGLSKKCEREVLAICDLLERGLLYISPQVLAVLQLSELKRQSTQLEKFNTDLAMSIGEQVGQQFQSVMSPMKSSLGALNTNMEAMSDRLSERLGEGVGKAIESATNGELRALGQTLEALRSQLEGLSQHVQGSGEDAARQIRAAGADFAQAASDIREAFSGLTGQVGEMGRAIATDTDIARTRQAELLTSTIAGLEAANAKTADVMSQAADALRGAGVSVAGDLQERMGAAMTDAAKQAESVIRTAINESGAAFAESGKAIIEAVELAASRISALAAAIEKSERNASNAAEAFQTSADGARSAAGAMSEAAGGFAVAASPVATAAKSFQDAAARIAATLDQSERAAAEALKEMTNLSQQIRNTQETAEEAWASYRARFEGVDLSLEKTLGHMVSTLGDSMSEFRKFAQDVDTEMGRAISRLANSMSIIEENADSIAQFAEALRSHDGRIEAAE
jgi:Sec-independent protein translocase protein TatA